jgi:GWxTD domain-containing protein
MRRSVLIVFVLLCSSVLYAQSTNEDHYEKGIELYNEGDLEAALQTWVDAFYQIEDTSLIDPRIGSTFIELVARNRMTNFYQAATEMYYWGLSTTGEDKLEDYLKTEIQKNEPVFDEYEFNDIEKVLKKDSHQAAQIILQNWEVLDPTPGTRINERLIEHWERIAYSKEMFTKADNTIYGTDDRALLYVKYGKPGLVFKGRLKHETEVIYSSVYSVAPPTSYETEKLLEQILKSHFPAEYEVWVYPFLSEKGRLVKIFGEKYSTRSFQEIEVVSDFIPSFAFNKSKGYSTAGGTYTPGFFLLHSYLEQLSTYDSYFSGQFTELNQILSFPTEGLTTVKFYTDVGWVFPFVRSKEAEMHRISVDAPSTESTYFKSLDEIDVDVREYGYYDEEGEPFTFYVMNSYPLSRMLDYMSKQERENLKDYSLTHAVSLLNENLTGHQKMIDIPELPFLSKAMAHPAQSIFKVSSKYNFEKLSFSIQLYDKLESDEPGDSLLPKSLLASGKFDINETKKPKPVNEFDLSDVMLGYQFDEANFQDEIPFLIAIDNKIPDFSNLFIHFQAVNLSLNSEQISKLSIELSVVEKKRGLGLFRRSKKNSVTANYQGSWSQIRESFEFEIVDREPGNYELTIKFTDRNSGITKSKKIPFELVDTE